jgi:hypothetical protein
VVDVLVAVLIGTATEVEALIDAHGHPGLLATAAPSGIVLGGLLLLRRKRPLLAMTLVSVAAVLSTVVQVQVAPAGVRWPSQVVPIFAIAVLSYSLGAFGSRRDLLLGFPQPLGMVAIIDRLQPSGQPIVGALAFFAIFVAGAPALGGRLIRGRQRLLEALAEQRRQLDLQRAIQTRTALAMERLDLAERLNPNLAAGLDAVMIETNSDATQAAAAIETRARTLLAATRQVVVWLAAAPEVPATTGEYSERAERHQRLQAAPARSRPRPQPS